MLLVLQHATKKIISYNTPALHHYCATKNKRIREPVDLQFCPSYTYHLMMKRPKTPPICQSPLQMLAHSPLPVESSKSISPSTIKAILHIFFYCYTPSTVHIYLNFKALISYHIFNSTQQPDHHITSTVT